VLRGLQSIRDATRPMRRRFSAIFKSPPPSIPGNYQTRSKALIEEDVATVLNIVADVRNLIAIHGLDPTTTNYLEIGPGSNFGAPVILAETLASVALVDRWMAPWDRDFHPAFYGELRKRWPEPSSTLDAVIANGGYPTNMLRLIEEPAAAMSSVQSSSIDITYSNAVMEHVAEPADAIKELARVSKPGAIGVHQIDFRDHSDFDRPLDHLLIGKRKWRARRAATFCECGTQYRASEFERMFSVSGFSTRSSATLMADERYFSNFISHLRANSRCSFKQWPEDDLRILSARYEIVTG
jgi:hypothetical protein